MACCCDGCNPHHLVIGEAPPPPPPPDEGGPTIDITSIELNPVEECAFEVGGKDDLK